MFFLHRPGFSLLDLWRSLADDVGASGSHLDMIVGFLVRCLKLLDELESAHSLDDAAEDDVLVVEEGQGRAHCHVELRLVRVARAILLAHAEESDLGVTHVERFVLESTSIDGRAELRLLRRYDLAHLQVHALDDTVHLCVDVAEVFAIRALGATAEAKEVGNGARGHVMEQLKVDGL